MAYVIPPRPSQPIPTDVCTRCGKPITGTPVLAVYGDPAFWDKPQVAFALDKKCFEENQTLETHEWVTDETGVAQLQPVSHARYVKA